MFRPGFLLIPLLLLLSSPVGAVEVVVNTQLDVPALSRNQLRAIFSMRLTQWPEGPAIRVFVLNDNDPLHRAFSKQLLGVFPHQLRRAWDRKVFSGTGQAPLSVTSQQEMRQRVADTPGAIGYLPEEMIDESVHPITIK